MGDGIRDGFDESLAEPTSSRQLIAGTLHREDAVDVIRHCMTQVTCGGAVMCSPLIGEVSDRIVVRVVLEEHRFETHRHELTRSHAVVSNRHSRGAGHRQDIIACSQSVSQSIDLLS